MKTTEHGIEDSKDVENMYHMRLMTLLQELVRERGYKGAARVLEIDQRTVAESATTGKLSRKAREALERALQGGVGSAAARQRERNDRLEEELKGLKGEVDALGKETRRRMAALERGMEQLRPEDDVGTETTGAGQTGAGPTRTQAERSETGTPGRNEKPPVRPWVRRDYPDLVTFEPAEDDKDVFGDVLPLIVEWRELKAVHPIQGRGLDWLVEREHLLEMELTLLEEHDMTLPPEKQPLRGLDRRGQTSWRKSALHDTRRARARSELLRDVLTLRLWRRFHAR